MINKLPNGMEKFDELVRSLVREMSAYYKTLTVSICYNMDSMNHREAEFSIRVGFREADNTQPDVIVEAPNDQIR